MQLPRKQRTLYGETSPSLLRMASLRKLVGLWHV
jgi:hypothetical protein